MVILVVDQDGILAFERERDPPVPADRHRPATLELAFELMEPKTRQVHVLRYSRGGKPTKHQPQSRRLVRADTGPVSSEKEAFKSTMPEANYHAGIVTLRVTQSSEIMSQYPTVGFQTAWYRENSTSAWL